MTSKYSPMSLRYRKPWKAADTTELSMHKGFQPSFDAKEIYSLPFFHQKLDYIHHNPVSGKWKLSHEYTDYPHSSAAFYVDNKPHEFVSIADYRDYWF